MGGLDREMSFYWERWRGGCLCGLVIVGERVSGTGQLIVRKHGAYVGKHPWKDAPWEREKNTSFDLVFLIFVSFVTFISSFSLLHTFHSQFVLICLNQL